ncbi:MAG: CRTAC1 family protein [Phycisphaerales bacterium]|nr:CRTAC1 family protein [Phycisphaerales bacterium]
MLAIVTMLAFGAPPAFSDVSATCGIDAVHRTPEDLEFDRMLGGGAVIDVNQDGRPDLFMLGGGAAPDRLYVNQGDGTFVEESGAWGLDRTHRGSGIAVGDVDRDGRPDLFVTSRGSGATPSVGPNLLYLHRGDHFDEVASAWGIATTTDLPDGMGAAFGDVDLDGDLDLFTTSWFPGGGGNRLALNMGDHFIDATHLLPDLTGTRGFTPRLVDLDGDAYPEVLLVGDFGTTTILANDAGRAFRDRRDQAGVVHDRNGMGSTVGDFDLDGRLDWFVSSIFIHLPPMAPSGNCLYMGRGDLTFEDQARVRGVQDTAWAWGCVAFDADLDADLDLAVTNGWPDWFYHDTALYLNDGAAKFTDVGREAGLDDWFQGRTVVDLDLEGDGDRDLVFFVHGGTPRVYRNDTLAGHWLALDLDTSDTPCLAPDGFGARVTITTDRVQTRVVDGNPTFLGAGDRTIHVGLGDATSADLDIAWPDGTTTTLMGVEANRRLVVRAPHGADFDGDGVVGPADLDAFLVAFHALDPRTDQNRDGAFDIFDIIRFVRRFDGC